MIFRQSSSDIRAESTQWLETALRHLAQSRTPIVLQVHPAAAWTAIAAESLGRARSHKADASPRFATLRIPIGMEAWTVTASTGTGATSLGMSTSHPDHVQRCLAGFRTQTSHRVLNANACQDSMAKSNGLEHRRLENAFLSQDVLPTSFMQLGCRMN